MKNLISIGLYEVKRKKCISKHNTFNHLRKIFTDITIGECMQIWNIYKLSNKGV